MSSQLKRLQRVLILVWLLLVVAMVLVMLLRVPLAIPTAFAYERFLHFCYNSLQLTGDYLLLYNIFVIRITNCLK